MGSLTSQCIDEQVSRNLKELGHASIVHHSKARVNTDLNLVVSIQSRSEFIDYLQGISHATYISYEAPKSKWVCLLQFHSWQIEIYFERY